MKIFKVSGTITREVTAEIEAETRAEATEKFADQRCDYQESFIVAVEVDGAVEVEEVE